MTSLRCDVSVSHGRKRLVTPTPWLAILAMTVLPACASSEPPPRSPEPPPPVAPAPLPAARVAPPPTATATARPEPTTPPPVATNASAPEAVTRATPVAAAEKPEPPEPPAAGPDDVEGANMRMGGVTADGVRLSDILCRTQGGLVGGLFGGLTVTAGFKARKTQLDACAPKGGAETRVKWTAAGGRMTSVRASGPDAKVNRCVEKALAGAPAVSEGVCAATVRHGKP